MEIILAYVDDVVVLENSRNKVTRTTMKLLEVGKIMGLEVNREITKYMYTSRKDRNNSDLLVDNVMSSFVYVLVSVL